MTQNDNMRIWNQVQETDPAHTKAVQLGRKFTTIDAQYQIMRATEVFGPVGQGWWYDVAYGTYDVADNTTLCFADVTICWQEPGTLGEGEGRVQCFGPVRGCNVLFDAKKERVDEDAFKKAMTDGLTKALSHLGFSADVFLGRYDDNKYVAAVARKFESAGTPEQKAMVEQISTAIQLTRNAEELTKVRDQYRDDVRSLPKPMQLHLAALIQKQGESYE